MESFLRTRPSFSVWSVEQWDLVVMLLSIPVSARPLYSSHKIHTDVPIPALPCLNSQNVRSIVFSPTRRSSSFPLLISLLPRVHSRIQKASFVEGETALSRVVKVAGDMFREEGPKAFCEPSFSLLLFFVPDDVEAHSSSLSSFPLAFQTR